MFSPDFSKIPSKPGIYIFKDKDNTPIYVGKAAKLKNRISSYFQSSVRHSSKTKKMISQIYDLEYIETSSEEEALLKENEYIKKYQPKYNILLRDDKTYPYIKVTMEEVYPRIFFTRKVKKDGSFYFGPYPNVGEAKKIISYLLEKYKLRDCKYNLEKPRDRACLNFQLKKCYAPCIRNISEADYLKIILDACKFLQGRQTEILKEIKDKMAISADALNFEEAAQLRDMLKAADMIKRISGIKDRDFDPAIVLTNLKEKLELKKIPLLIEAFDISNISGKHAVGSMVVFQNGLMSKRQYRKFRIKTYDQPNDVGMMQEVILRRYRRLKEEGGPLPDLILIDGGKGQLNGAFNVLKDLGLDDIDIIGLAKRLEMIYKINKEEPIILNKYSEELFLLQRIRDEAHRFAIAYHKKLRGNLF